MDELVKELIERAGLSEDQARAAVQLVVGYIAEHPEVIQQEMGLQVEGQRRKTALAGAAATVAAAQVVVMPPR